MGKRLTSPFDLDRYLPSLASYVLQANEAGDAQAHATAFLNAAAHTVVAEDQSLPKETRDFARAFSVLVEPSGEHALRISVNTDSADRSAGQLATEYQSTGDLLNTRTGEIKRRR